MRAALIAAMACIACLPGCGLEDPFTCTTDSQCLSHEGPGRCEPDHACSFPDAKCGSGQRYGSLDGKGLGGICTDAVDLGGDDLSVQVDGAASMNVAHLTGVQAGGTGALSFAASTTDLQPVYTVDTTALQIDGEAPADGVIFEVEHEATSGAELAVLRVGTLTIESGLTVRVNGSRGLVVVASGDVTIYGVLDGSAQASAPGPGGSAPGTGPGAGRSGSSTDFPSGAGYGTPGAAGAPSQSSDAGDNPGGASYGDDAISTLLGGSGGGAGVSTLPGGAGGGIVQITSATRCAIQSGGGINAGGGGPRGAYHKQAAGGSGGSVFLEAPIVQISGTLAANGGGGTCESDGEDGSLSTNPAAGGGCDQGAAGSGGAEYAAPTMGIGSGGAVGRISILYGQTFSGDLGTFSPTENVTQK